MRRKENIWKRLAALCLMVVVLSASTFAAPLQVADEAGLREAYFTQRSGVFRYATFTSDGDVSAEYCYDDSYFFPSSYSGYNPHLATMSLCFAMSTASKKIDTYETKCRNAQNLLEEIGFTDFAANGWFYVKPTRDSIGAVIARKTLIVDNRPYTLLALAIRGGEFESEWAGCLTVGESGLHQGFREARDQVLTFVQDYIDQKNIEGDLKLWITGFSRGAATANLLAGALDDGTALGGGTLRPEDLYAYTFGTPQGVPRALGGNTARYANIFNVISLSDPASKVAPSTWDFTWYGETLWLPSRVTDPVYSEKLSHMLARYEALGATERYAIDDFAMKTLKVNLLAILPGGKPFLSLVEAPGVTQDIFLNDLVTKFAKETLKSRKNYVKNYQEGMRELMVMLAGTDGGQWKQFQKSLEQRLCSNIAPLLASTGVFGTAGKIWAGGTTVQLVENYITQSLREAGITSYDAAFIRRFAVTLSASLVDFALSHPVLVANLFSNLSSILQAHAPEIYLAWMQSMDTYYAENGAPMFGSGSYRVIRVNCPVDVAVYDADGNLIASIVSDDPQDVGDGLISVVNEDGEKLVYLPAVADYTVEVVATQEGTLSYSVNEYSPEAGEVSRLVNYYGISIETGMTLTGDVPAYDEEALANEAQEGSSVAYALSCEEAEIAPDDDLSGLAAAEAYYSVEVVSANEEQGTVMGQGIRQLGNFAQVEAMAGEGYAFEGWYLTGERVSTEAQYRFLVDADVTLEARFIEAEVSGEMPTGTRSSAAAGPVNQVVGARIDTTPTAKTAGGRTSASVQTGEISAAVFHALEEAKASGGVPVVTVRVQPPVSEVPVDLKMPRGAWKILENKEGIRLAVQAGDVTLNFSTAVIRGIGQTAGDVTIHAGSTDVSALGEARAKAAAGRPVYELRVQAGETEISEFAGGVLVSLPYALEAGEAAEAVVVSALDGDARKVREKVSTFYARENRVTFTTRHFSLFVVDHHRVSFSDVTEAHWGHAAIEQLAARGLVAGVGRGRYSPDRALTRAEFVQLLANVLDLPAPPAGPLGYRDVTDGAWYHAAVSAAEAVGLLQGLVADDGRFLPDRVITREEMAVLLANLALRDGWRAAEVLPEIGVAYDDAEAMDGRYRTAIAQVVACGLMTGVSPGVFDPKGFTTRAQAAQVVLNLLQTLWSET